MKTNKRILCGLILAPVFAGAQITTPVIRANFGVDGELRCNYFNGLVQSGNDDWFRLPGSTGTGQFVVDTTGAAALLAGYTSNPSTRNLPFYRTMRFPNYAVINNRLLIDAYFVRDYHGDDSTIFAAGSNKNGMSPASWSCPVSQSIPDKNELLDVMIHVRRAGPNLTDSMWLFGGVSIENTTGNRYFDFEMYQTDILYNRTTRQFINYGPDAGHTSWQFDASGNMLLPGDIILTAEYSSSALSLLEARIWVHESALSINPVGFNWTGSFDGDGNGAEYGYAGIQPKTAGAFYTGLQSASNTWAGPYGLVLGDNSIQTNYSARQYMEFSVNLSKLGLDDASIFGGDDCVMPFRRVMVKSRASTSFTSELKDFVGPFDFFLAPRAAVETALPMLCDTGVISTIYVSNPIPTSYYHWSTLNGNIIGPVNGTSITIDTPGVYIVYQYLQSSCSLYASDTITVGSLGDCVVLNNRLTDVQSRYRNGTVSLQWKVTENEFTDFFNVERSYDGKNFSSISRVNAVRERAGPVPYHFEDVPDPRAGGNVYYRIQLTGTAGNILRSRHLHHLLGTNTAGALEIYPNPVKNTFLIQLPVNREEKMQLRILDMQGRAVHSAGIVVGPGQGPVSVTLPGAIRPGPYQLSLQSGEQQFRQKLMVVQ